MITNLYIKRKFEISVITNSQQSKLLCWTKNLSNEAIAFNLVTYQNLQENIKKSHWVNSRWSRKKYRMRSSIDITVFSVISVQYIKSILMQGKSKSYQNSIVIAEKPYLILVTNLQLNGEVSCNRTWNHFIISYSKNMRNQIPKATSFH